MPFVHHLTTAIETAAPNQLDHLSRSTWSALAQGAVSEAEAQTLAELIEARRGRGDLFKLEGTRRRVMPSVFSTGRRPPRSPDRQRSIERRRRLAASGPLPPALASSFTTGELAALHVVGAEALHRGYCGLALGEIAGRSGVSISTARRAVREAQRIGLLKVEERRRFRAPSLTNVLTVVSAEWRTWLDRGPKRGRQGEGVKSGTPRIPVISKGRLKRPVRPAEGQGEWRGRSLDPPPRKP